MTPTIPNHSSEYYAQRKPFLERLENRCAPHWARFRAGEISHQEYCELIQPALKEYSKDPKFQVVWEAHGGSVIK